jgi:hypothetical protein
MPLLRGGDQSGPAAGQPREIIPEPQFGGDACTADLVGDACTAAGGTMSTGTTTAPYCICP